jgi:hypothetical protein
LRVRANPCLCMHKHGFARDYIHSLADQLIPLKWNPNAATSQVASSVKGCVPLPLRRVHGLSTFRLSREYFNPAALLTGNTSRVLPNFV